MMAESLPVRAVLPQRPLDHWLRFHPSLVDRFEREHGNDRVRDLRHASIVGLLLYNAFSLIDFALVPDVAWQTIPGRILLGTPACFLFLWLSPRVSPTWRERMGVIGLLLVFVLILPALALSKAPFALLSFANCFLYVVFANMLLALRFRHACLVTALGFAMGTIALLARVDDAMQLKAALMYQYAIVCVFTLYANYLTERRRCRNYLAELSATLRSEFEEQSRHHFESLSMTDALTGLPN